MPNEIDLRPELAMECPLEFGTVPDCSCPYEHWHLMGFGSACLDVHLEEDGSAHLIFGTGDFEAELVISDCKDIAAARQRAMTWVTETIVSQ